MEFSSFQKTAKDLWRTKYTELWEQEKFIMQIIFASSHLKSINFKNRKIRKKQCKKEKDFFIWW